MPNNKNAARLLDRLEQARTQIGSIREQEFVRLLSAAGRISFGKDTKSLIRFHDLLLFLRAFAPGQRVLKLADKLLSGMEPKVKAALAAGADPDDFAPEEVAGIAGTVVEATFSYAMAQWLVKHHPEEVSIQWEDYERDTQRGLIWPRFLPLLEEDSLIEAHVPFLDWLKAARGRQKELPWLVQQFERLPISEKEKAALYDLQEILIRWSMSGSQASRTLARKPVKEFYFHHEPLIQRRQVSFAKELAKPPLRTAVLPRRKAEKALDMLKEVLGVRYRELYGTSLAEPVWVVQADTGRGVEMYVCGLPPQYRLPLRAYLAGFTVKNGVPINYFECSSLFEWAEIGFNTFFAYRDGETAWIYAQTLRLLRQFHGTKAISIYPYQIGGDDNEEAIESGAFWFYRKLGFRSMDAELEKLAQREEEKVKANPKYRTPPHTLRRLSKASVVYETPGAQRGAWNRFATRNIGYALQRRMARDFNSDVEAMRHASVARLARELGLRADSIPVKEKAAFADFAMVMGLVPSLAPWSADEKSRLRAIITAKAARTELRYQKLLLAHDRLRQVILSLGSQNR